MMIIMFVLCVISIIGLLIMVSVVLSVVICVVWFSLLVLSGVMECVFGKCCLRCVC